MLEFVRDWIYALPVSKAVQETILEGLRLAVVSFLSVLVGYLADNVKVLPYPEVWGFLFGVILRLLDKCKHEANKEVFKARDYNGGLLGF